MYRPVGASAHTSFSIRPTTRGVTLVEMAVVVLIFGILVTGGLSMTERYLELQDDLATREALARQEAALEGHLLAHGRLPGVDSDGDGRADRAAGPGLLPVADLGVGGFDGWRRRVRYDAAEALVTVRGGTKKLAESLATLDDVPMVRIDGGPPFPVACLVVSLGPNGRLDADPDGDRIYDVFEGRRPPAGYDDRVEYVSPLAILGTLGRPGGRSWAR